MMYYDNAVHMMEALGGSFVRSLAECYLRADSYNKIRLRNAFEEYFDQYESLFKEHVAKREKVATGGW